MYSFILWDVSPELFEIGGFSVRWYGLLFAMAFLLGQTVMRRIFRREGKTEKQLDSLTIYGVLATVIGARLGHCLFYEPEVYLADPVKILYVWEGGLASHGAALGLIVAIYLYCRKQKMRYVWLVDRMVLVVALAGGLIRTGNVMNSEIVGTPTEQSWGMMYVHNTRVDIEREIYRDELIAGNFKDFQIVRNGKDTIVDGQPLVGLDYVVNLNRPSADSLSRSLWMRAISDGLAMEARQGLVFTTWLDGISMIEESPTTRVFPLYGVPRHPGQMYEGISNYLLFAVLMFLYWKRKAGEREGLLGGIFLVWVFSMRFVWELFKENQVAFEDQMSLNMGQILSLPLIAFGLFLLVRALRQPRRPLEEKPA